MRDERKKLAIQRDMFSVFMNTRKPASFVAAMTLLLGSRLKEAGVPLMTSSAFIKILTVSKSPSFLRSLSAGQLYHNLSM